MGEEEAGRRKYLLFPIRIGFSLFIESLNETECL